MSLVQVNVKTALQAARSIRVLQSCLCDPVLMWFLLQVIVLVPAKDVEERGGKLRELEATCEHLFVSTSKLQENSGSILLGVSKCDQEYAAADVGDSLADFLKDGALECLVENRFVFDPCGKVDAELGPLTC